VTNAVKHFKFEERGKRRLHKKPSSSEILACRPWLEAELSLVRPRIVVCLGATAVQSVLGKRYQVLRDRGKFFPYPLAEAVTITIHPSAILRAQTPAERHESYRAFVRDLAAVRQKLAAIAGAA
jgi:DNA polymerase